jgi:two-component system, OmpR family, KDP operon response regulator KdpE
MAATDTILIIDDEIQIRMLLSITLSANGYHVVEASTGKEGLAIAASVLPSCIILDLGLPDMEGHEILKRLREWCQKPVIILSVRNTENEIVRALDGGANDYITKPFRSGELLARIRMAIRQGQSIPASMVVVIGDLTVDLENHVVRKGNAIVKLTPTEFSLLALFVRYEGRVLTHQYILKEVWGMGYLDQTQYLRVFVAQLRKKIEDNPLRPKLLLTESGIGYRFGG